MIPSLMLIGSLVTTYFGCVALGWLHKDAEADKTFETACKIVYAIGTITIIINTIFVGVQ